ncbi:Armadillo [Sarocladium implicatum]|nr:Armadillo [Sarocladium implicatum]
MERRPGTTLSPADVAALLQREGSGLSIDDYDEASQSLGARQRRAELLGDTLATCQTLWSSGSGELDLVAENLGNGSRDIAWRLPFGDSKILDFFLGALTVEGLRHQLQIHALRLIGNSCADTDENRERVVQGNYLPAIIRCLQIDAVVPYAIPVLYNILVDYEPAQMAASQAGLSSHLVTLFSTRNLPNLPLLVPFFCKILALLVTHECEATAASPMTVDVLLQLATSTWRRDNIDDLVSLASVAVAYLAKEEAQSRLVMGPNFGMFLALFDQAQNIEVHSIEDEDTKTQFTQLRTALLNMLADLSAHESFTAYHPLSSPTVQILLSWLSGPNIAAACLALGNLSRSDAVALALVQEHKAHVPLTVLLSDSTVQDSQILHGSLSFLKNLAIPTDNKPVLGELLSPGCVPRIYSLETLPQVHFAAASLTRLLLVNCQDNVRRLCAPLAGVSPGSEGPVTSLQGLLGLFKRSDAEPTRLEAARAVAALCRVLHSTPVIPIVLPGWDPEVGSFVRDAKALSSPEAIANSPERGGDVPRREAFYQQHDLSHVLGFLITQQKWPILQSEAWFVFALMCRSRDGSEVVRTILTDTMASNSLVQAVTGQQTTSPASSPDDMKALTGVSADGPSVQLEPQQVDTAQKANMARVDRENAVVLCTELLKFKGNEITAAQQALLQDLVNQGTQLIAAEKATRLDAMSQVKQEPSA